MATHSVKIVPVSVGLFSGCSHFSPEKKLYSAAAGAHKNQKRNSMSQKPQSFFTQQTHRWAPSKNVIANNGDGRSQKKRLAKLS